MDLLRLVLLCCLGVTAFSQNNVEQDIKKLTRANAFFADKLYKQLSKSNKKLIFSPLSISAGLSMLYAGSHGKTSTELNSTLGYTFAQMDEQELFRGYENVVPKLTEEQQNGYQFSLANSLFLQKSSQIYPNYTTLLAQVFQASTKTVDFSRKKETLDEINGWVRKTTKGKITSVLNDVSQSVVMALVNAVFFKGDWADKFDKKHTADGFFTTDEGSRKPVKLMSKILEVNHKYIDEIDGFVLQLPYKHRTFSMFFILPKRGKPLRELEEKITPETLLSISEELYSERQEIKLPKLKLQSEIDMIPYLQVIGVKDVFSNSADLSLLSSAHLKVDQVRHKATMELNEEGSEASAATAVIPVPRANGFWLDRPFMFLLRHNPTNAICFMGKVSDV